MKALLVTASVLLVVVCFACSLKYLQDESAWQKEQDALTRLQSGMKYEPILMLRSQLADADAGVEEYASKWRVFPRDHGGMVQAAKRGILYVSNALDWDSKANSQDAPDTDRADALALAVYADVTTSLPRSCFNGQIAFSPKIVAADFALYGEYWLELAQGKYERQPIGSQRPLDANREAQSCERTQMLVLKAQSEARAEKVSASRAAVAAERAKEQAFLAEYPFEVQLSSYYPCSFTLSIDGHTATEVRISSGAPESFRIHRSAELNDASCEGVVPTEHHSPSDEVEVRVNGANYVPKWILEKSAKLGKSYEAVIAPATN